MTDTMTPIEMYHAGLIDFTGMCDLLAAQVEAEERAEAARVAKVEELDTLIGNLEADLDSTPNRSWTSEGARFRLSLLIDYTARRHLLSLAS